MAVSTGRKRTRRVSISVELVSIRRRICFEALQPKPLVNYADRPQVGKHRIVPFAPPRTAPEIFSVYTYIYIVAGLVAREDALDVFFSFCSCGINFHRSF